MGRILPDSRLAKIEFFENRNPTWSANSAALGTTAAEMTALTSKTTAARDAYSAQQIAQAQAKAATVSYYAAVTAMVDAGNDVLQEIKAKAAVDGDSVYALALIPPPATPAPVGPPGMPTNFTATLDPTGVLNLAWKCANPTGASGTIYQVSRQVGTTGTMQIIGAAGDRKFIDATLPIGSTQVTYRIMALRSTVAGTPNEFTVKFGVSGPGGEMTASIVTAPKLAA